MVVELNSPTSNCTPVIATSLLVLSAIAKSLTDLSPALVDSQAVGTAPEV